MADPGGAAGARPPIFTKYLKNYQNPVRPFSSDPGSANDVHVCKKATGDPSWVAPSAKKDFDASHFDVYRLGPGGGGAGYMRSRSGVVES